MSVVYLRYSWSIVLLLWPVVVGTWVHVGIGNAKLFPYICANPVGWVLVAHRGNICLVLARTWHVEVLCTSVKLHSESKLGLLLSWSIHIVRVARVREIKVTWDVILGAWHTHVLHGLALLVLHAPDFGRQLSAIVNGWAFSTLCCHAERRCS